MPTRRHTGGISHPLIPEFTLGWEKLSRSILLRSSGPMGDINC